MKTTHGLERKLREQLLLARRVEHDRLMLADEGLEAALGGQRPLTPNERAALTFTEAEVAFLFPAPVSRRTLIHFKLLKSQLGILFATLIFSLLTNRFGRGGSG